MQLNIKKKKDCQQHKLQEKCNATIQPSETFCFPEDGAVKQGLISLNWPESSHYTLSGYASSKLLFHGLLISPVRRAAVHNISVSPECQGLHAPAYLAPCGGKWGSADCDSLGSLPLEFQPLTSDRWVDLPGVWALLCRGTPVGLWMSG